MRLGTVIGRVTLSQVVEELRGARWLIVSPYTSEQFKLGVDILPNMSKEPSLIVYDNLGAAIGQTIGFVEGREAAQPFEKSPPIDAISVALIDNIFYSPFK